MQCNTEAKRMADESVDDMAAEASIIPPASPPLIQSGPPHHQLQLLKGNASVTAPSQISHDLTSQPPPPPTLPKFQQQTSPELKRPDSAYGGSGGTPSLLSTESIEGLPNNLTPPPNPRLQSPSSHPQTLYLPNQQDLQCQSHPPTTDRSNNDTNIDEPSTYADSAYDDVASLNGSITDTLESAYSRYRWENGRRYHSYRDDPTNPKGSLMSAREQEYGPLRWQNHFPTPRSSAQTSRLFNPSGSHPTAYSRWMT
ncbi:MAG: hypothetical protein Q9180_003270 [Flavoplaca navasiana]